MNEEYAPYFMVVFFILFGIMWFGITSVLRNMASMSKFIDVDVGSPTNTTKWGSGDVNGVSMRNCIRVVSHNKGFVLETQKIFGDHDIVVNPTAVRVPVFYGHSEAVHLETRQPAEAEEIKAVLRDAEGIVLFENDEDYPTVVTDSAGTDPVFVGRVRKDISHDYGINLWVTADNIRKGAALNSVQIAEVLIRDYY